MNPQQGFSLQDFLSLCDDHGLLDTKEEIDAFQTACAKWISDQALTKSKLSLCEVGCGFGRLYPGLKSVKILGKACDYTGVDASPEYISHFHRNHPEARLFVFDVLEDDLSLLGKFDIVFLPYTLIHLFSRAEQERLLISLQAILHEDGVLIIDRMSPEIFGNNLPEGEQKAVVPVPRADRTTAFQATIYFLSESYYEQTFASAGFSSVDIVPYLFVGKSRQQYMVLRSSRAVGSAQLKASGM
jgi:SAM-dependent methyltransferase